MFFVQNHFKISEATADCHVLVHRFLTWGFPTFISCKH